MAPPFPSSPAQTLISLFVIFPCSGSNESASSIPLSHRASAEDPGRHICHAWPASISTTFAPYNFTTGGSFGFSSTSSTCVSSRPIHKPLIEHAAVDLYLFTPVFSSSSASSHRRSSLSFPSGPLYIGTAFDPIMSPNEPVFVVTQGLRMITGRIALRIVPSVCVISYLYRKNTPGCSNSVSLFPIIFVVMSPEISDVVTVAT